MGITNIQYKFFLFFIQLVHAAKYALYIYHFSFVLKYIVRRF
jgi:hypothetical protein